MKRLRIVVSLPNDNAYQHEQRAAARSTAQRLGLDLQVIQAADDSTTQNQQLLKIIESSAEARPNAFLVEPLSATGLRRVAEAAVTKGIAWVMSNSEVDYIKQLRKSPSVPVFTVTQGQREIGQLQGKQLAALLPEGGSILCVEGHRARVLLRFSDGRPWKVPSPGIYGSRRSIAIGTKRARIKVQAPGYGLRFLAGKTLT